MNDPDPDVGEPLTDGDGDGDADEGDGDGATDEGPAGGVGALVVGGAVVGGAVVGVAGAWLGEAAGATSTILVAGPAPPVTLAWAKPPASVSPLAPIIVTMAASGSTRRINLVAISPPPSPGKVLPSRPRGQAAPPRRHFPLPRGTSRYRVA